MGVPFPLHGPQVSGTTSECLLDVPYEAYTDSPETADESDRSNIRIEAIPHKAQGGPQSSSAWRRILTTFIPAFAPRLRGQDEDEDEDALPLLSEYPQQKTQWKQSRRSRWSRCFVRGLVCFFAML